MHIVVSARAPTNSFTHLKLSMSITAITYKRMKIGCLPAYMRMRELQGHPDRGVSASMI